MDTAETHAQTFARLVEATETIGRIQRENERLTARVGFLEQEGEALREMISRVANGGQGAVL